MRRQVVRESRDVRVGAAAAASFAAAATALLLLAPVSRAESSAPVASGTAHFPQTVTLTTPTTAHAAAVLKRVAVRARPTRSAPVVTTLEQNTSDGALGVVLVLSALHRSPTSTWYRIRLPILPNNSTGWVPADALGALTTVRTHLYI